MAARASGIPTGSPVPQPWNLIRFMPFFIATSRAIRLPQDLPYPVLTPYTGVPLSSAFSSRVCERSMRLVKSGLSLTRTRTPSLATRRITSRESSCSPMVISDSCLFI